MSLLNSLYELPQGIQTRWASPENPEALEGAGGKANAGRKGAACFPLPAGEARVLASCSGHSGTLRRIWITIADRTPDSLRGLRLDIFWDEAATPGVSVPMGDFFGHGLGRMSTFQSALFSSPEGRSFNCCIPMPFRRAMKVVLTNESGIDQPSVYYDINFTVGDRHAPEIAYFHAIFRREHPTTLQRDFEILPRLRGRGRYVGVTLGVAADTATYARTWWGEGEVKIYLDGDEALPTLCGTGTEDYIGTAWGQGQFAHAYQGCPLADHDRFQYCFYRFHIPDPVFFARDVRVTIQQIGAWWSEIKKELREKSTPVYAAGPGLVLTDLSRDSDTWEAGLFERHDDWSACAYFYLNRPENDLPPLAPFESRRVKPLVA